MNRFQWGCGAVLLCTMLAGCDRTTAQEHTANGQESLAQGEVRTAVIELKNALQKDPQSTEARRLLGEAHLRLGDHASAVKEFERALDLGLDTDAVRLGLLRSKAGSGRYQEIIGELEDRGALEPPFAVVLADAYLNAGDPERAEPLYRQGASLSEGRLGLGLVAWNRGNLEQAETHFAEALRLDPANWQAWLQRGEFHLSRNEIDQADAAFTRASELPAATVLGRVGLARVELMRGNLEAAAGRVQELLRLAPEFVVAHYLDGLVRFQQQDLEGAEAAIREVQRTAPAHPPSLYLMGAIQYRLGEHAQAENNLQRYLAQDPSNSSAAKLLASVRFDQGNHQGVVEALEPFVASGNDPQLLALHGTAHMLLGNATLASRSLERSVELAPDMAPFRNQLALSLLASGDQSGAEAELESAIEVDGEQFQSDYLLAMLRLRDGDWEAAGEAVDALVEKNPGSPIGHNLRGAVALGKEDRAAARESFRQALETDPSFLPAVRNLARLDELEGDREQAAQRYRTFLESHAGHEGALISLAELSMRAGDPDEAVELLERSVAANASSVPSAVGLARLYLAGGQVAEAGEVLDRVVGQHPDVPDLLLLQAEVAVRSGNAERASRLAATLQSHVAEGADHPGLLLALGRLQARLGEAGLARSNLHRVLAQTGDAEPAALRTLARLDLQQGDLEAARRRLETLQGLGDGAADDAEIRLLEADLLMAEGRREEGAEIYAELAEAGVREGVMRLGAFSLAEGRVDEAVDRMESWLEEHPDDLGAELLLADALMRRDQDAALARYESLVDTGNPVVLNNLAWLYMEKGDDRAVEIARRAAEAAPNNPDVLDTLGWVLLKQAGDTGEAVKILRRSVQLNPANPSVQYHLGVALRDSGDKAGARRALATALESDGFPEIEDARTAMASL